MSTTQPAGPFVCCLALVAGTFGCQILLPNRVESTQLDPGVKVLLTPIEDRDPQKDAYFAANFRDMLEFHLAAQGVAAGRFDPPAAVPAAPAPRDRGKDPTSELLPKELKKAAGEERAVLDAGDRPVSGMRPLSLVERAEAIQKAGAKYMISGSVSRMESGTLLDIEENYVIFFRLFDHTGKDVAAFSYAARGDSLRDARKLRETCVQLAIAIRERVRGKAAK